MGSFTPSATFETKSVDAGLAFIWFVLEQVVLTLSEYVEFIAGKALLRTSTGRPSMMQKSQLTGLSWWNCKSMLFTRPAVVSIDPSTYSKSRLYRALVQIRSWSFTAYA